MADYKTSPNDLAAVIGDLINRVTKLETNPPIIKAEAGQLKIIRGTVSSAGAVTTGEGYTITKGAAGVYTVEFTVPFSDVPAVTVSAHAGSARYAMASPTATNATIVIMNATPSGLDTAFSFTAEGLA